MQLGFSDYDRACREVDNDSRRFYFLLAHEVFSMESIKQDPVAQILASEMSLKGLGTPTDRKIAILFLTMAANRGHLLAQGLLAEARLGGDTTEAGCKATREPIDFRTTRLKAEQGNVVSQFKLHSMYRDGVGVERDPVQAMAWLNKAVGGRIEIERACSPGLSTLVEQPKPSRAKSCRLDKIPVIHRGINKEKSRKAPNKDGPPATRKAPKQRRRWVLDCVDLSQRPDPRKVSRRAT